jgi:predicted amidohydrolase
MAKPLTIAAAQMVFRPDVAQNLAMITDTIHRTADSGVDIILFPECAVTGYNRDFTTLRPRDIESALATISQTARRSRCNVLVGCPTFTGRKRLNSLLVFDRRGTEVFRYSKIHLTPRDAQFFVPGNKLAFFHLDQIPCTAIICHERRYPELVRLPVMLGAQILFHPNAGLDSLEVSKSKRRGRDGMTARAFENQIYYIFANSVGPQGNNLWSAGDSKIVAPDTRTLAQADNRRESVIHARVDPSLAARKYATEALQQPAFFRPHWKSMLAACKRQLK